MERELTQNPSVSVKPKNVTLWLDENVLKQIHTISQEKGVTEESVINYALERLFKMGLKIH